MSQPLPLSPQLPSLDGRLSVPRDRPTDNGERSAQRHNFGRLLDRFTQSDQGPDQTKDAATSLQEPRPRERSSTTDDSHRPADDATDSDTSTTDALAAPAAPGHHAAAGEPAKPAPEAAPNGATPGAAAVQTIAPLPATPTVPTATTSTDTAPAAAVVSTIAAAMPAVAASPMAPANDPTNAVGAPAATPAAKAVAAATESPAEGAAPEASADIFALAPVTMPTARSRRAALTNGATEPATKAAAAASAAKAAAAIVAPQADRLPAARVDTDPTAAANSNQPVPQIRIAKVDANAAAVDATALAAAHEEHDASQGGADRAVAGLTSLDSPRRTAALYHKVADAAKPGADTPTPADQISIRLIHAVAEGKRAIQMHLHPAELGSIDVKMQWQGDKLTAQFTVDRPETLQLLQREVPALERSLGQAGVNVDSGSLSFSLRQQQGNGKSGGDGFDQTAANAGLGDGGELAAGEDALGQVIRDGILSIRV